MTSPAMQRGLYFITPSIGRRVRATEVVDIVKDAIVGGAQIVQWRQKPSKADFEALPELRREWDEQQASGFLLPIARQVREITKEHGVPLIINDSFELALELDADGVHVGQTDTNLRDIIAHLGTDKKDFIVGVTVRDGIQAQAACSHGATYLGVGPVFTSSTKPEANDGNTIGLQGLKECVAVASTFEVPVYAIGGLSLTERRIQRCIEEGGACGAAVIAAISDAQDRRLAAAEIRMEIDRALGL
ncbi:hypothetical protein Poli38472_002063 [Pythium oligandrum]|uniref:thiamine phosphate synthase n=1 Tax=Pythium oligandrum TaxID=41045 RepID=A0A8K1FKS3_PYTOL|nr:hypothetical protein Poli38472_002063 [Pythium oligandrum]|eukprot:TMW63122.1 hypothetical protein Poli38472_002063 [Pythium oligandrum]